MVHRGVIGVIETRDPPFYKSMYRVLKQGDTKSRYSDDVRTTIVLHIDDLETLDRAVVGVSVQVCSPLAIA